MTHAMRKAIFNSNKNVDKYSMNLGKDSKNFKGEDVIIELPNEN